MVDDLFWKASVEELTSGVKIQDDGQYVCLICGRSYRQGVIYEEDEQLMEAPYACAEHVRSTHGGMFHYLTGLNKKLTGLTELQAQVLGLFYDGASDGEIAENLESSASTVRHHRFKLREREKQARIFLALMQLWKEQEAKEETEQWVAPHRGATMIDDRYQVTDVQRDKILANYFPQGIDGPLKTFPAKEKRKLVVLRALTERFERNRSYTEKEVNDILGEAYHDQVTLRRYLIEYGFMTRTRDGSSYRLT